MHHAHVPKAIEVSDGKTCFYSLSNFIMTSDPKVTGGAQEFERNYGVRLWIPFIPACPTAWMGNAASSRKRLFQNTASVPRSFRRLSTPNCVRKSSERPTRGLTICYGTWNGCRKASRTGSR